ncbi:hypothetical protein ABW21_db0200583 [Orbilia brochopaga]|nr:hypothetical protein ABW21_db0200583 [Drechslerella brochopaga]
MPRNFPLLRTRTIVRRFRPASQQNFWTRSAPGLIKFGASAVFLVTCNLIWFPIKSDHELLRTELKQNTEYLERRMGSLEEKVGSLEENFGSRMKNIEESLESVNTQLGTLSRKADATAAAVEGISRELKTRS